jgi:segregation and condensation protein A
MNATARRATTRAHGDKAGDGQVALFDGFAVTIEIFEGPLDLLLHLVRREEVDVAEVRVSAITEQYLTYLGTMAELNIQLSAEFVVTAATLMLVKSRSLLPVNPAGAEENLEEEIIEAALDPEAALHRRLQEYKVYREAAEMLEQSRQARQRIFLRGADDVEIGTGFVPLEDVSVFDMIAAVQEMLARAKPDPPHRMRRPAVSVGDRIEEIIMQLTAQGHCRFSDLVAFPATRLFIIVTFLAVLELVRRRRLRVRSGAPLRDFIVELVPTHPS